MKISAKWKKVRTQARKEKLGGGSSEKKKVSDYRPTSPVQISE